jgi:acetyl-CoA C-acetyltransferase
MPVESPLLVGGGQTIDKPDDPTAGKEPLDLLEEAARRAADDAGGGGSLLAAVDTLAVPSIVCHDYGDAPGILAERLGCRPARTISTTLGGNTPQALVNHLCDEIVAGRTSVALIAGAEAWNTMRSLGRAGKPVPWKSVPPGAGAPWGDPRPGSTIAEARHGAAQPISTYPLYENAFRAARGMTLADQRRELADFAATCSAIAARNPYAWFRNAKSAAELGTVTAENRMIGFPYPKFMNAILDVNQGAAILLTSASAARRLGLALERAVYPWAGVDVIEHWFLLDRVDYHTLPGVRRAGQALLAAADVSIDRIAHLDLYSCFPIASRLSAAMLGVPAGDPRPLTLTGGLPWFGGPGNNYTTHAIVSLVERLRETRDAFGLVHANGWHLTKHALGVYGGTPPPQGWRHAGGPALQAETDALPHPVVADAAEGSATIETYTIMHGRDGAPERGTVIGRLADGRRFIAVLPQDRTLLEDMERAEQVGRPGSVRHEGELNRFTPA